MSIINQFFKSRLKKKRLVNVRVYVIEKLFETHFPIPTEYDAKWRGRKPALSSFFLLSFFFSLYAKNQSDRNIVETINQNDTSFRTMLISVARYFNDLSLNRPSRIIFTIVKRFQVGRISRRFTQNSSNNRFLFQTMTGPAFRHSIFKLSRVSLRSSRVWNFFSSSKMITYSSARESTLWIILPPRKIRISLPRLEFLT